MPIKNLNFYEFEKTSLYDTVIIISDYVDLLRGRDIESF